MKRFIASSCMLVCILCSFGLSAQVGKPQYLSNWTTFMSATMDDKAAEIVVDLGVQPIAPAPGYVYQSTVMLRFLKADSTGLHELRNPETITKIEEKLTTAISRAGGVYFAKVTSEGLRDYYFYLSDSTGFNKTCKQVMAAFPGYVFQTQVEHDPYWFNYYSVFPDEYTLQIQYNQDKLAELTAQGDSLAAPRMVEHFASFPAERDRDAFEEDAIRYGYTIIGKGTNEGDLPWGILFGWKHAVDAENIQLISLQLVDLAMKNGGYYDGWECEPVR